MQLMKMNADLINVPESRSTDPNVSGAVLREPAVLLAALRLRPPQHATRRCRPSTRASSRPRSTSPRRRGSTSLYADRGTSPVPILGRVAAKRAPVLRLPRRVGARRRAGRHRVPAASSTGCATSPPRRRPAGPAPRRSRCSRPRQLNTAHTPDPDSAKFHENDRTITLRVPRHRALRGRRRGGPGAPVDRHRERAERPRPRPRARASPSRWAPRSRRAPSSPTSTATACATSSPPRSDGTLHVFSMKTGLPGGAAGLPLPHRTSSTA